MRAVLEVGRLGSMKPFPRLQRQATASAVAPPAAVTICTIVPTALAVLLMRQLHERGRCARHTRELNLVIYVVSLQRGLGEGSQRVGSERGLQACPSAHLLRNPVVHVPIPLFRGGTFCPARAIGHLFDVHA